MPVIFSSLGSAHSTALLNTVVINSVNLVCTFVAIALVDRFGRRGLFLEGGIQMIITLFIAGAVLGAEFNTCGLGAGVAGRWNGWGRCWESAGLPLGPCFEAPALPTLASPLEWP